VHDIKSPVLCFDQVNWTPSSESEYLISLINHVVLVQWSWNKLVVVTWCCEFPGCEQVDGEQAEGICTSVARQVWKCRSN